MRMKKTLQTAGVTLLGAVSLLLVSALLFTGIWALLPDRMGETHSYDMPSSPSEAGMAEALFPWDRMTVPWTDGEGSIDDEDLSALIEPFLEPWFSLYAVNWEEAEFLCDETETICGFRNVEIQVRSHTTIIVDKEGREEAISDTESVRQYRFSIALREKRGSAEVCFVSLEPVPREENSPAEEEAGLAALTDWVEKRELNIDSGSPFATFLWHFMDFCGLFRYEYDAYDYEYDAYGTALLLFETGVHEITSEGHVVYCTFTGKEGEMTLLCDPASQTVYGISLQRN